MHVTCPEVPVFLGANLGGAQLSNPDVMYTVCVACGWHHVAYFVSINNGQTMWQTGCRKAPIGGGFSLYHLVPIFLDGSWGHISIVEAPFVLLVIHGFV